MGRAPCCDKANVKKGPWSPEEDETLKHYIQTHGTGGNWIALPQKAGLRRCGKSCRLRWLNYLRPNIKHGQFSDDEDKLICALFASIGSRWSIMAAQLPGRTDNDIKNYWNTKLKKKMINNFISMPQLITKPLHHLQSFTSAATNYTYPSPSNFHNKYININSTNAPLSSPPPPASSSSSSYMYSTHASIPSSPTTTTTAAAAVSDHQVMQSQDHVYLGSGPMESYQGVKDGSTLVMFGGDQAAASSSSNSDGSCHYEYGSTHHVYNNTHSNMRSSDSYKGLISVNNLDDKEKGYYGDASMDSSLEEIKQLISTNLCSSNINDNMSLNFFVDEAKEVEKVMYY
ncbi:hypothetical protein QVD17_36300 [Tagetes erecta]|uniref:Transcription factor RAX2 n=1 Tax=Tagetes erecta TaxID=13708 RepID=A0AAD8NIW3_TARER|nr:hypothetical protein QVD17_36300 [Tagetes erecta]